MRLSSRSGSRRKLAILADAAKYDASCASGGSRRAATAGGLGSTEGMGICHSYTPDGRCVSLLKILFTNICIDDCRYCTSRISSDVARARFTVEEVVRLTLDFYRKNFIEGLFLRSGVLKSPDYTMEQLQATSDEGRGSNRERAHMTRPLLVRALSKLWAEGALLKPSLSNERRRKTICRLRPDRWSAKRRSGRKRQEQATRRERHANGRLPALARRSLRVSFASFASFALPQLA